MRRHCALLICGAALLLSACAPAGKPQPPEATAVPTYPSIQQAVTPQPTLYANEQPPPDSVALFQTQDKPDTVLAYYNNALAPDGWTAHAQTTQGVQEFTWEGGCPLHRLLVTAVSLPSGMTTVEVKRYDLGC